MNPQMSFPAAWTSHSLAALCLRFWVVLSPSFCLSLPVSHTLSFSSSSLRPTQPSFCPHYFLWLHPLLLRPQPFLVLVVPVAGLVTLGSFPLLCFCRSYNRDGVLLAYLFFFFLLYHVTCGILFPNQGLNPCPLHWKHSLNHWTAREVPLSPPWIITNSWWYSTSIFPYWAEVTK